MKKLILILIMLPLFIACNNVLKKAPDVDLEKDYYRVDYLNGVEYNKYYANYLLRVHPTSFTDKPKVNSIILNKLIKEDTLSLVNENLGTYKVIRYSFKESNDPFYNQKVKSLNKLYPDGLIIAYKSSIGRAYIFTKGLSKPQVVYDNGTLYELKED